MKKVLAELRWQQSVTSKNMRQRVKAVIHRSQDGADVCAGTTDDALSNHR